MCDTCKDNYYTSSCNVYCDQTDTCNDNGLCDTNTGLCNCYSSNINGFWINDESDPVNQCSICNNNYFPASGNDACTIYCN